MDPKSIPGTLDIEAVTGSWIVPLSDVRLCEDTYLHLGSSVISPDMFRGGRRKPENPERVCMDKQGTCQTPHSGCVVKIGNSASLL